ncbi:MAG: heme exporter protein CcmD [Rubrivivax sp.]
MNWNSASEFFDMGGHGLFVWGSYAVCLLVMTVEPVLAVRRRRQALQEAAQLRSGQAAREEEDA